MTEQPPPTRKHRREIIIPIRFTREGRDELDRLRGPVDRSKYIRSLVSEKSRRDRANQQRKPQ